MVRAVQERQTSPLELVEEAIRLAERVQPVTNAFSQLHPEPALEAARSLTERAARGQDLGPLGGVPVAVKDLFDVEGWETTGCCRAYQGRVAERDAEIVTRLRRAGAVIIGKTNQHELAAGATNAISACGPTRNPWDPSRITGGSSGGSAAVVASGVVPLALGSDTGGSIRIPASMCGLVGLKPTRGLLSLQGLMPLSPSLDTPGPLARTAEDAELAFSVLGGNAEPVPDGLEGMTVGTLARSHAAMLHPEVLDLTVAVAGALRDLGARIVAVVEEPPIGPEAWEEVAWTEFARAHGHLLERPELLHPRTVSFLERGRSRPATEERMRDILDALRMFYSRALDSVDFLLAAATPFTAPAFGTDLIEVGGGVLDMRLGAPSILTRPVNLAGIPALALPAGFTSEGLPVGVQLIGRAGGEAVLLAVARLFQQATDHHLRAPEVATD